MNEAINIYPNRENTLLREVEKLKKAKISEHNKQTILRFHNFLFAQGSKFLRVSKLSGQLRRVCLWLNKDLSEANINDIENIIAKINQIHSYTDMTRADYRRAIKQFYKWYKSVDERRDSNDGMIVRNINKFYEYIEAIKCNSSRKNIRFDDILTDEEINKVLKYGFNGILTAVRDRAFISLLHETGMRTGEILTMRLKCVKRESKYAQISIDGKTGVRNILIVSSIPYLYKWFEQHPFNNNPQAPVWCGLSRRYGSKPLSHRGAFEIVHKAFKRMNLYKTHNLHWFRHSRATLLSQHLTEVQLCKYMGWTIGSRQVRTYVHASDKQTEDSILRMHGIEKYKVNKQLNTPMACPICSELNTAISDYCCKCGTPLSVSVAVTHEEQVRKASDEILKNFMELITKDPSRMQEFLKFKETEISKK